MPELPEPRADRSGFTEPAYGGILNSLKSDEDAADEESSQDFVPKPGVRVATIPAPKLQIRVPPSDRRAEGLGERYDREGWEGREGSEDNVSVFEEHSDDSLFNLVAGRHDEDFEDPPSDVIEFGPLPRGRVVVKEDRVTNDFSNEEGPREEPDAQVWSDDRDPVIPSRRQSRPRAWWETGPSQAPELPQKRQQWDTPDKAPDFKGATRDDKERKARRSSILRAAVVLLVFLFIGGLALSKLGEDEAPVAETTPSEAPVDEAPVEVLVEEVAEEPLVEEPPEVVEEPPEVVEEPPKVVVEAPTPKKKTVPPPAAVETPGIAEAGASEEPEAPSIAATAESEEAAAAAIYDTGVLRVESEPRALIYIDGRRRGYTPVENLQLQPGNHLVKAVVPGRAPKYSQVRIDPGGAHIVPFTF